MRRFSILTLVTSIFVLAMGTSVAMAEGVHFTHGGEPTCTISNTGTAASAACDAEVAGLGGGDIKLEVTLAGQAVYQCKNQGGNIAPGQNQVLVGPETTPVTVDDAAFKNGRVTLDVDTTPLTAPTQVSAAVAGCPNNNWIGVNPDLEVTSIKFSAVQGGLTIFTCTKTGADLTGTIKFADWTMCSGAAI